jgi:ketosteroid isomerase-like protein
MPAPAPQRFASIALIAFALLTPRALYAQVPDNRDRAAVQRVLVSYADNVQSGNLAAVEALFVAPGPELHILYGDAHLHTFAEYRDPYLKPETQRFSGLRYTHSGIETVVHGDVASSVFRWQMAGSGSTPAPILGRASALLQKVNGEWKIVVLHLSK